MKDIERQIGRMLSDKLVHPVYETRFSQIASRYLRTYFFFDFLACAPIFTFEAVYGFTTNYKEIKMHHCDSYLYHLFFFFKLFKLLSLPKVVTTFNTVVSNISTYFYMHKIKIDSTYSMLRVILKTLLSTHLMNCLWIRIMFYFPEESNEHTFEELAEISAGHSLDDIEDHFNTYYSCQMYFIITTVTTVGYGEVKPISLVGRIYIMFVQFFGILIFTEYKVAISNIQAGQEQSVDQLVLNKTADIMSYMYDISKFMHGKKSKIDGKIYDDTLLYIEEGIRYSTKATFKSNKFWKLLPPKLKDKLVMATLNKQIHRMRFFFEDMKDY